jgi:hexosaminidase
MRSFFSIMLLVSVAIANAQSPATLNLMPVPKTMAVESGKMLLTGEFRIGVHAEKTDTILYKAVNRMYQHLNKLTGLYLKQEYITSADANDSSAMIIRVKHKAGLTIGMDESYQISIRNGKTVLEADNTVGALHGLETMIQLLAVDEDGYYFPLVTINDAPRFVWRGLMIDVSRHFMPADLIKRNIDAMSAVKMNVLHLHLSDDQGFRVESKLFPKLHGEGSNGEYYTQIQIRDMISYAAERGILIVPEFDMPGHATSWFAGYPELATTPGVYKAGSPYKIDRSKPLDLGSIMKVVQTAPFPTFSPTKESVYAFLDRFIGEMSTLFPAPYFHIGADENNGVTWRQDSVVVAFMRKNHFANTHDMQAYFVSRVQKSVAKYGKTMIGWDELFSKNLAKNTIVQVWSPRSAPTLAQQVRAQGNPVIISKGLYLDYFLPAYIHYSLEFPAEDILGGEAAQWTEIANAENLETRMWPRAAAVAERFWSPREVRDSIDMYRRLFIESDRLAEAGLRHQSGYDRMVLGFSAGFNEQATGSLMDVLTPVKGYKRLFGFFSLPEAAAYPHAPLVRAADIAMVDPEVKWEFRKNVTDFLSTKSSASERAIRDQLTIWSVNHDQLQSLFVSSPLAKEIETHSKNLSALSLVCMNALDQVKAGKQPDATWIADQQSLLKSAKGAYGEVELSVLPEMTALITGEPMTMPTGFPMF